MTVLSARKLRAFTAHDGDEQWDIIYAKSGVEARRRAAGLFDCDFSQVERVRRAPSLDQFSRCTIPVQAILALGWWVECTGCLQRISEEEENTAEVIGTWDHAYCSPSCFYNDLETKLMQRVLSEWAVAELSERVTATLSDVKIIDGRAYVDAHGYVSEVSVFFSFPGSRYSHASAHVINASIWRSPNLNPPPRHLGDPPREIEWRVANGDLPAWHVYRNTELWYRPGLPFMLAA